MINSDKLQIRMKAELLIRSTLGSAKNVLGLSSRSSVLFALFITLVSVVPVSHAKTLTWDADVNTTGPQDGAGDWNLSTNWWAGTSNVAWANGNGATFGTLSGSAANYTVSLSGAINTTNLTAQGPASYTLTGAAITATRMLVTNGVTLTFDATATPLSPGNPVILASNCTLNIGSAAMSFTGGHALTGPDPNSAIINATNGTHSLGNQSSGGGSTFDWSGVTVNISNAIMNCSGRLDVSRNSTNTVVNVYNGGQLNVNSSASANAGAHLQISRGTAKHGTVNVYSGGLVTTFYNSAGPAGAVLINSDSGTSDSQSILNVLGGTVQVGLLPFFGGTPGLANAQLGPIKILASAAAYTNTDSAQLNISSGLVAAKSIEFGMAGGNYSQNPTNQFTMTGGALYLDAPNIVAGAATGTNLKITLSGGTIGATASWSPATTLPMTLGTSNGNITFQAADIGGTPFNIAVNSTLTGTGGLNKTGGGTLTLGGANNYSGTTVVSNGVLKIKTSALPSTNGPVVLDGSAGGTPAHAVEVNGDGQYSGVSGDLTYAAASSTLTENFNYLASVPSGSVAPLQVSGNVVFTVTPQVTIEGSAIPVGTYPLIKYGGTVSGTPPTAPATLPAATSGYISNSAASKTICLVVTTSPVSTGLAWRVGNGVWDINTTANWSFLGSPANYTEPNAVQFDDNANGSSPITVTLNANVSPTAVTASAGTKRYIISGDGAIAGGGGLTKTGNGTLTLSGTNTYSGGTMLSGGQLDINYGGDGVNNSAIGTGPLTNQAGTRIDNTSGQPVTLLTPIAQSWSGDWTFVGTTNLNTGLGGITLDAATVSLTVASNILEVDGAITDNGTHATLVKQGGGTLTLSNSASWFGAGGGGLTLAAGQLNINTDNAIGQGEFTLNGGAFDNTSGANLTVNVSHMTWAGSFSYVGTTNITLVGSANVAGATLTVINGELTTDGAISGANTALTKNGPGTWTQTGTTASGGANLTINGGTVNLGKTANACIGTGNICTVNSNATLAITYPLNPQIAAGGGSVVVNGGIFELNGGTERPRSVTLISGAIQNCSTNGTVATIMATNFSLAGTKCVLYATNGARLNLRADVKGSGTLTKTGNGVLQISSNSTFTGQTIISAGTLTFGVAGSISNSPVISLASGTTLDVANRLDQAFTLNSGQTLTGAGSINGSLITGAGSTLLPGVGIGALTVISNVTLGGRALFELNRSDAVQTNDALISVAGTITGGGTLDVVNVGPDLQVGDKFYLFSSAVTGFSAVSLPTTNSLGNSYSWSNDLGVDGSISVASVGSPINPSPGQIQFGVRGGALTLSWPTNLGWILQVQTNSRSTGLGTNWVALTGSENLTSTNFALGPANGAVFYRLVRP
jgi:autotransporter-associated beta strand protein